MNAGQLRALRSSAVTVATAAASLLELIDAMLPSEPIVERAEIPKEILEASKSLQVPAMFGRREPSQASDAMTGVASPSIADSPAGESSK